MSFGALLTGWAVATTACFGVAAWAWRGTKPFDEFLLASGERNGRRIEAQRWIVWAPATVVMICGAGLLLAFHLEMAAREAVIVLIAACAVVQIWISCRVKLAGRRRLARWKDQG
jgi:hypothetical protein